MVAGSGGKTRDDRMPLWEHHHCQWGGGGVKAKGGFVKGHLTPVVF